jgi:chromosome segregation ATPase
MASPTRACKDCQTTDQKQFGYHKHRCKGCYNKYQKAYRDKRAAEASAIGASPSGSQRSRKTTQNQSPLEESDKSTMNEEDEPQQPAAQIQNGTTMVVSLLEKANNVIAKLKQQNKTLRKRKAVNAKLQEENTEIKQQIETLKRQKVELEEEQAKIERDIKESAEYKKFAELSKEMGPPESETTTE